MSGQGGEGERNFHLIHWPVSALVAAFCVYRLAVFTPQPLDSPGTLRPILYRFFIWFLGLYGDREDAFDAWYTICVVALLAPVVLAVLHYGYRQSKVKLARRVAQVLGSRWIFWGSIAGCLVLCRYPTLLENELNPDEGQFLASAHKLFYDPNFFHSVDCGTSGPINIYPLMLPAILGFSPDFASSRTMVLVIVWLSAFLLYRSVELIASEELARIAVLPFIGAFAVFRDPELVHYSSEHVPLLLISLGLYVSVRVLRHPAKYRVPMFLLGLLTSAAFFAKMQSAPVVAGLAAVSLGYVYAGGHADKRWHPVLMFVSGAIPLLLINAALCVAAGVSSDFWMSYIGANASYGAAESRFVTNLQGFIEFLLASTEFQFFLFTVLAIGVARLAGSMRRRTTDEHSALAQLAVVATVIAAAIVLPPLDRLTIYAFLGLLVISLVSAYLVVLFSTGSLGDDPVRWFGLLALVSVAAALFSVYRPHHAFVHYLLLLFAPLCASVAWMLAGERIAFVALVIGLTVTYDTYLWGFQDGHVFRNVAPEIRAPEGDFIRSLTSPRGRIFVWGWTVRPYLSSGRVSATRDTNVSNCFRSYNLMTSPPALARTRASKEVESYYEERIVRDLRGSPPEVFVDAVGPTSWFLADRNYFGFEQFPEIADFVKNNYRLLRNDWGQRIFLRKDLVIE